MSIPGTTLIKMSWRSLWRNRRRTLLTVSSIALGTTLSLFFISMADGMYKKLIDDAVRMNAGHVTIERREYHRTPSVDLVVPSVSRVKGAAVKVPGVRTIKPLIQGQAMVSTGSGSVGVSLVGVDPLVEKSLSPIASSIVTGRYLSRSDVRGVVIGSGLAQRLDLEPGMKLVLTCNDSTGELVNEMLRVSGIFTTGMEEADGFLIQVNLSVARRIFQLGPDEATQVGLLLEHPDEQDRVITELENVTKQADLVVLPWQDVLPDLAGFMAVDKGSNYVFQAIILFLLSFTILNTILMSVLERTREFATLLAIGTSPFLLRIQVIVESALLGIIGTGIGLVLGGCISYYFQVQGLDLRSLFGKNLTITGVLVDPIIRNEVSLHLLLWLGTLVFGLTMIIGLYPALRSTRISLPDILRNR
ncbi:MAG: ABC transporter permease [Desulfomonilia bacterium]